MFCKSKFILCSRSETSAGTAAAEAAAAETSSESAAVTAHTAQHTAETSAYYHTARAASAAVVAAPPLHHITAVAADVGGLLHHLIPRPGDDLGTDTLQRPLVTARTTSGEHEGDNDNKKRHAEEKEEHANRPAVVLGEFRQAAGR